VPKPRIAIVGGGSYTWSPQFNCDVVVAPELKGSAVILHDIASSPLELVFALGKTIIQAQDGAFIQERMLDIAVADTMLDEMLEANRQYLPQLSGT
jgi:alpha-galactosidase/6-phospho-beta-glucosidase family protein